MAPTMYKVSKQKCYGSVNNQSYTLRISDHCNTKRYINRNTEELRQIESMSIKRLNYIIREAFSKFKEEGKYLIIVSDETNVELKHHILVAYELNKHHPNSFYLTIVTMMTTTTENVAFKRIPIANRVYFKESFQTLLMNREIMSDDELYQFVLRAKYVPGLLEKQNTGLKIVKKKLDIV